MRGALKVGVKCKSRLNSNRNLVGKVISNKNTKHGCLCGYNKKLSLFGKTAFLSCALFGEILILEIPVVGKFSLFAGLHTTSCYKVGVHLKAVN